MSLKQTEILNMPKYALVTINRFKYDLMSGKKLKILQHIEINFTLDFSSTFPKEENS